MPEEYYLLMKKHSEIKWTEIMRSAVTIKLRELEDAKFKKELLIKASENWDDAHELFKF
jgi:hypothetical protein